MDLKKPIESIQEPHTVPVTIKPMECIRKFPLIQQFPSTIKEFNTAPWSKMNIKQLPTTSVTIKNTKNTSNLSPPNVPCKKLRIVSPNGKDLGEFNVEVRDKDTSKEQIYTITKSSKFKPVSKPVMLTLNPLAKKTLPRILRQPSINVIRNKMMKITPVEENISIRSDKCSGSPMELTSYTSHEIIDISDDIRTSNDEISDNELKNRSDKVLIPGNEANQKSSLDCTANDNNSQKHPEISDKPTTSRKDIECTADNINTLLKDDGIKTSTTLLENNEVTPTKKDITYKEIAESPFPKVSCKRLVIPNKNKRTHSKINKRKSVSTTKTARNKNKKANKSSSKVLNYVGAHKQKDVSTSKKGNTKTNSRNNTKSHSKQVGSSRKRNNLFQINSKAVRRRKQIHEKTQKDIMTIVPSHNSLSFGKNTVSTLRHGKYTTSKEKLDPKDPLLNNDVQSVSESRDIIGTFDVDAQSNDKDCSQDNSIQKNISDQWDLIKRAVNSVKDERLRAQALKALADCSIGVERHVPKHPPEEMKSVHDTQMQTAVFGLLDPKFFVLINKDIESIHRIQQITLHDTVHTQDTQSTHARLAVHTPLQNNIVPNTIQQNILPQNSNVSLMTDVIEEEDDFDIDSYMKEICEENLGALQVKEALSTTNLRYQKIIDQLQKDFELAKKYDENGMLSIHNAVVKSNIFDVQRYMMVLKQCKKSADIMTMDGVTSLELAIKYEVRGDIVKFLLQSGAQPVKMEPLHESALIIGAKQSSALLPMLVNHISNPKLLDEVDSEGFAALHYCCKQSHVEGVEALLTAGANVNLKDMKSGRTPLFHALESDNTDNRTKVVQRLLQAEAVTNVTNFAGQPPLPLPNDERKSTFMMSLRKSSKISSPARYLV